MLGALQFWFHHSLTTASLRMDDKLFWTKRRRNTSNTSNQCLVNYLSKIQTYGKGRHISWSGNHPTQPIRWDASEEEGLILLPDSMTICNCTIITTTAVLTFLSIESPVHGVHLGQVVCSWSQKAGVFACYEIFGTVSVLHELHSFDKFLRRKLQDNE